MTKYTDMNLRSALQASIDEQDNEQMTEPKWATGPWTVRGTGPRPDIVAADDNGNNVYICENVLGQANANLTAAAPELYEALNGIRWKDDDKDNMEFAARIPYTLMDEIRAALAKARGET